MVKMLIAETCQWRLRQPDRTLSPTLYRGVLIEQPRIGTLLAWKSERGEWEVMRGDDESQVAFNDAPRMEFEIPETLAMQIGEYLAKRELFQAVVGSALDSIIGEDIR